MAVKALISGAIDSARKARMQRAVITDVMDTSVDYSRKVGELRDIRYDPRALEQSKQSNLRVQSASFLAEAPVVKLSDFEGRGFISTMADRTAAAEIIQHINNVKLKKGLEVFGGQAI